MERDTYLTDIMQSRLQTKAKYQTGFIWEALFDVWHFIKPSGCHAENVLAKIVVVRWSRTSIFLFCRCKVLYDTLLLCHTLGHSSH